MSALPHKFGTAEISSPELKKVAMQCMENFLAISRQMAEVQMNVAAIMRSIKGNSLEIIAVDKSARSALAYKADLVNGKVPASELPSYVDDVLEFPSHDDFPDEGEQGKIYVAIDTGKTYRWSGSVYVEISPAPDLSGYVPKTTKVNGKPLSGNIDIGAADIAVDSSTTVAQSLSAKRDKGDLAVYDSQGQATADTLAKTSEIPPAVDTSAFVTKEFLGVPEDVEFAKVRAFTGNTTYYVGDIVEYNSGLSSAYYTCKTEHQTSATPVWNSSNWFQITDFSSTKNYPEKAIAVRNSKWYRRKSAGSGAWNASDWMEVRLSNSAGLIDAYFVNSVVIANPTPPNGETVSFVVRMSDLVPDTIRQYAVGFYWNKIVSGSLSGTRISTSGLSNNITSTNDSGTETRTGVTGTTDITVSLAKYMECAIKVYLQNS